MNGKRIARAGAAGQSASLRRATGEERVRRFLETGQASEADWGLLRAMREDGWEREEMIELLAALREVFAKEAGEDRILEMLDIATGWCRPGLHVWD